MEIEREQKIPGEVGVIFKTSLGDEYVVEEVPITLDVASTPAELSEVILELLKANGSEIEDGISFSFRINGKLLRGGLKSFMIANSITGESTIEIIYNLAPALPSLSSRNKEDDWISSILCEEAPHGNGYSFFYVNTFGGALSIYNEENKRKMLKPITTQTIMSSELIEWSNALYLAQGCENGELIISKVDHSSGNIKVISELLKGDLDGDAITSLALNPVNTELLASGTRTGNICMWRLNPEEMDSAAVTKGRKALKIQQNGVLEPIKHKAAHFDGISGIKWLSADRFVTSSLDHSFHIHECERLEEVQHVGLKDYSATSLEINAGSNEILIGHEDGYIRLFDDRGKSKQASRLFKSHDKWVSSIEFHPSNKNIFSSVQVTLILELL